MYRLGRMTAAVAVCVLFGLAPAHALLIGPGQSATIDFDFSASQGAIDVALQPLTLTFEMTTTLADQFDDPSGMWSYEYLDIGAAPVVNLGYDATGGVTSLGLISFSLATTDLVGSLRITMLTESIDLASVDFGAQDFDGFQVIETSGLSLPESVDVEIPEPQAIAIFGLALIGLAGMGRRRKRA